MEARTFRIPGVGEDVMSVSSEYTATIQRWVKASGDLKTLAIACEYETAGYHSLRGPDTGLSESATGAWTK